MIGIPPVFFMSRWKPLILSAVGALCVIYIVWSAGLLQSAAATVDRGTRPLAIASTDPLPGPVYLENDSYYWLMMAQRMGAEGVAVIRETKADNVPFGRPVYWSQSIAWMIRLLSGLPVFSSQPDPLVAASYWVNPVIQSLTVLAVILLLGQLSPVLACLTAILFVSMGDVTWAFSTLRPDHQSLQVAFTFVTVLLLFTVGFGFGRPGPAGGAANVAVNGGLVFGIAGVLSGMGLWVSAAAMMPVLMVITGGTGAVALLLGMRPVNAQAAAKGWVVWGLSAAVTSFVFWLVEFFPRVSATRLEVNNPGFSLWVALLGVAVSLCFSTRWLDAKFNLTRFAGLIFVLGLCSLLPGAILFGPASWYWPKNVYMDRLHNFIMEFYTYQNFVKGDVMKGLIKTYQIVLPLGLALAIPGLVAKKPSDRMAARILFTICLGLFAMSLRQIRWFALFAPILAASAAYVACYFSETVKTRKPYGHLLGFALVAVVVGQCIHFARVQAASLQDVIAGKSILNELVTPVLNKRVALALAEAPNRPTAILSDPNLAPAIEYFAHIPTVMSFYWENVEGARDATEFLADTAGTTAREIARRRKLSHVIVPSGYLLTNYVFFIKNGHYDQEKSTQNLCARLAGDGTMPLPDWMTVDYELDQLAKTPYSYRGETWEQYLNVYKINLTGEGSEENSVW
jgi:hypothetical protein